MRTLIFCFTAILCSSAESADRLLIRAATIHTVSGTSFTPGEVLISNGRIVAVGQAITTADSALLIDLKSLQLYPGLIAANTSLGLTEISGVRATQDTTEVGNFSPDVHSWIAVNPDSELIPVARAGGITHVQVTPQGGTISGQSGVIALTGWSIEDMIVRKGVALHINWPEMGLQLGAKSKSPEEQVKDREKKLRELDEFFNEADSYAKAINSGATSLSKHPVWDSMLPVITRKQTIVVQADDLRQIKAAVAWAKRRNYSIIIAGAKDAWRVADLLAKEKIPVIYDGTYLLPSLENDSYDAQFKAPATLHRANVPLTLSFPIGSWSAANLRNLPHLAAQATAHGLPQNESLRSITLNPAKLMGVDDRLGSIEIGKEATFIAVDGDLLDIRTNVKRMWIAGNETSLESRHTRLYDRYKNRPIKKP